MQWVMEKYRNMARLLILIEYSPSIMVDEQFILSEALIINPERHSFNLKLVIFDHILGIYTSSISYEISLMWMQVDPSGGQSTLL